MSDSKKVLVTGGAGFIGSNLSRVLLESGAEVDCVDNLITGRIESIKPFRTNKRFRFFHFDITDRDFFKTIITENYDEIYHLACPTGVPNIQLYGEQMLKTCSIGTENILQLASTHNAKVLYTSSAEVYGDPEVFPQHEKYYGNVDPTGPRSAYEEGKRFSEALVRNYVEKYHVDGKIVRIFNTFGIGMSPDDSRVIPRFLKQIKENGKIVIYGDGTQTRTHLYVDDQINGLMLVQEKGEAGEVYNIGGRKQLSIAELAEMIINLTSLDVEVEYQPHFIEDHSGRRPKVAKVREIGWEPRVGVIEGLTRMLPKYGVPLRENISETLLKQSIKQGDRQTQAKIPASGNQEKTGYMEHA